VIPTDDIQASVKRLLNSDEFVDSARLVAFLRYVVDQRLAGHEDKIKAKTIGMDVYGYTVDEIEDRESVVRVDAGRVRRKLEEYYAGSGNGERLRIELLKGSYVPEFTLVETAGSRNTEPRAFGFTMGQGLRLIVLPVAMAAVAAVAFIYSQRAGAERDDVTQKTSETSIFDVSPARVEAINLARHGQSLVFPATDPDRLAAALAVFQSAIETDANYFGGYAGAAQVFALSSLLKFDNDASVGYLESAVENSDRAVSLAPEAAWSLSAQAFAKLAAKQPQTARRLSEKAVEIAPNDVHIAEFDALISLFSTDFDGVIAKYKNFSQDNATDQGFVFDNALGSAFFHTGDYDLAVKALERGIANGGPFGPVAVAYLMAAHHMLDENEEAAQLAAQFMQTWPDARVDLLFQHVYANDGPGLKLEAGMRGAGWKPN
jgi:tetratricopeptide (TPR) repeat protein